MGERSQSFARAKNTFDIEQCQWGVPVGVHLGRLHDFVSRFGDRGQSRAAEALGITKSTLSRILNDTEAAQRVQWLTAERMARSAGLDAAHFWDGPVPRSTNVARGTRVREASPVYGADIGPGDERGGLWVIEQMSLALADIARRLRESTARK